MIFRMVEHCPLCGRNNSHHNYYGTLEMRDTIREFGIDELTFVICECGLIFQWWAMTPETLAEYYKHTYRKILGKSETASRDTKIETERAKKIIQFLDDYCPNNVLDIGSATGTVLVKLQNVYGCKVAGIEPDDNYREYSQSLGLNVLSKIEFLGGNQKFDLITATHVLEHFIEPMAFLEKIRDLVSEGGKLILEVPLMSCRLSHPVVFTEETLRMMLNRAGFGIRKTLMRKGIVLDSQNLMVEAYLDT